MLITFDENVMFVMKLINEIITSTIGIPRVSPGLLIQITTDVNDNFLIDLLYQ